MNVEIKFQNRDFEHLLLYHKFLKMKVVLISNLLIDTVWRIKIFNREMFVFIQKNTVSTMRK